MGRRPKEKTPEQLAEMARPKRKYTKRGTSAGTTSAKRKYTKRVKEGNEVPVEEAKPTKTNFDLSELNLHELVDTYNATTEFLAFLDTNIKTLEEGGAK